MIQGNYIGTDVTGSVGLGNGSGAVGVYVDGSNNIIGGTGPGEGNLISGNGFSTQGVGVAIPRPSATADVIDGNVVQGNLIGTDATGSFAIGNGYGVTTSGTNTLLGGITPGARNVISGNAVHGTVLAGTGDTVQGNFIGTDATGKVALGNAMRGVFVAGANALIGGTTAAARNIISANQAGIIVDYQSTGALIQGNFIGTDVTGKAALGNLGGGIGGPSTTGTGTVIGGTAPGAGNLISGNGQGGIGQAVGITIQGNLIGTDVTGAAPLPNSGYGVGLASNLYGGAILGGTAPGAGNTIAFNSGAGVGVSPPSGSLDNGGNAILGNSIFGNGALGIDLGGNGVTSNDPCDADGGANHQQNFPVLTAASSIGGSTNIQGTLNSVSNTTYRIEFFSNAACDPSAYGEGQTYLGFTDVTTDSACNASFNVALPVVVAPTVRLTATATDPNNNSSEFSSCISLAANLYTVTPCRVADTRRPPGPYGGPALDPTSDRSFVVAGQCGIPATAQAVAFNFAIVQPTGGGHIRVYPGGAVLPTYATMNYSAGQIRANNAIVPLGPAGDVLVHLGQGAGTAAHLVIDVNGYFQ